MIRVVVLPFGVDPADESDDTDQVLGAVLARDLATRLRVHGAIDVEYADPLGPDDARATYVYEQNVAAQLAPLLVERLQLDAIVFGWLELGNLRASLTLSTYDGASRKTFEWSGVAPTDHVVSLNVHAARALQTAHEVEPSMRELEAIERISTTSIDALRCFALAVALAAEPEDDAANQRLRLLEGAMRADPAYADAVSGLARELESSGKIAAAVETIDTYLRAHPTTDSADHTVAIEGARQGLRLDRSERAIELAASVARVDPWNRDAAELYAEGLVAMGRHAEAAFSLHEALWRFRGDWGLRRVLASALIGEYEVDAAHQTLEELAMERPDDLEVVADFAAMCARTGALWAAWEAYTTRDTIGRGAFKRAPTMLGLALGFPGTALVAACATEPPWAAGVDASLALLGLTHPEHAGPTHRDDEDGLFVEVDLAQGQTAHVAAALGRFRGAAQSDSALALLHDLWRAHAAVLDGDMEDAEGRLSGLVGVRRDAAVRRLVWLSQGAAARREESIEEAALALQIVLRPSHAGAIVRAASHRYEAGDADRALTWLAPTLDATPPPSAVLLASRILLETGHGEEAVTLIETVRVRTSSPELRTAYDACAATLAALRGDGDGCARSLRRVMQAENPNAAVAQLEPVIVGNADVAQALRAVLPTLVSVEDAPLQAAAVARAHLALGEAGTAEALLEGVPAVVAPELDFVVGLLAERRGDSLAAELRWRASIQQWGAHAAEATKYLAAMLMMRGQTADAITMLERALGYDPDDHSVIGVLQEACALHVATHLEQ